MHPDHRADVSRLTEMCDELPLLGDDHRMDLQG